MYHVPSLIINSLIFILLAHWTSIKATKCLYTEFGTVSNPQPSPHVYQQPSITVCACCISYTPRTSTKVTKFLYTMSRGGSYSHPSSHKYNNSLTSHTIYTFRLYDTISSFHMASMLHHLQHYWLISTTEHTCKRQDIYIHSLVRARARDPQLIKTML